MKGVHHLCSSCNKLCEEEEQGSSAELELVRGFSNSVDGRVVLCPRDHIDTDGMYAGRHCYKDLGPEEQAKVGWI